MKGGGVSRFERVEALFHAALEVEPAERAALLDEACGDDRELREEVESLLVAHGQTDDGFLETGQPGAVLLEEAVGASLVGRRVGAYRIEAEIGHGGMGTVYRARRDDEVFDRVVAIKLVRPGLHNAFTMSRFRSERRILAGLDHPNIARLLDGGSTEDGQPYFVMEYVEGETLDSYCRARDLGLRERLELFVTVCRAVHSAHQRLVVHRDLKPGNILVTAAGVPKLLDFGIAKVLDPEAGDDSPATLTALPAMTPAYASPEQVRGEPITTATDIYALGVVLCELLTDRLPYPLAGPTQEMLRTILEREPARPSALAPQRLRGDWAADLDNIVLMALRKEPARRYASALQLAEDIERHLAGQPVLARKDTLRYRARKFVRRHRVGVGAGALAVAGLIGGVVLASWQAHVAKELRVVAERSRVVAERNRAVAERRFNVLRQIANSLLFDLHEKIRDLPGSTPARHLLVKKALEYLDGLARDVGDERPLQRELAAAYQKLGDVQGSPFAPSLGDSAGARRSYEKAERLRLELVRALPRDQSLRRELAQSRMSVGDLLWITGDFQGALARYRQVLVDRQALVEARPREASLLKELRETYTALGDVLLGLGKTRQALKRYRGALATSRRMRGLAPGAALALRGLAVSNTKIGHALVRLGDFSGAVTRLRAAVASFDAIRRRSPASVRAQNDLIVAHHSLGDALLQARRLKESLAAQRRALRLAEAMVARDAKNAVARRNRFASLFNVAEVLREMGDLSGALAAFRRAEGHARAGLAADPKNTQAQRDLQVALLGRGNTLAAMKRWQEALASQRAALNLARAALAAAPKQAAARADLARVVDAIGGTHLGAGKSAAALPLLREAAGLREALVAGDPSNVAQRRALARTWTKVGDVHLRLGRRSQARSAYAKSVAAWARLRRAAKLAPADERIARRAAEGLRAAKGSGDQR